MVAAFHPVEEVTEEGASVYRYTCVEEIPVSMCKRPGALVELISISEMREEESPEGVMLVQEVPPSLERYNPVRVARYTFPS